jgi:uncharacterized protein YbbC (DUF1343 family)
MGKLHGSLVCGLLVTVGCATVAARSPVTAPAVRPGIAVLLSDSMALIRGKRIALLTNQTGIGPTGASDIELLRGPEASAAGVRLIRLFSPEHGIRGTEDRTHLANGVDERSGLPVVSLYTNTVIAPPDSLLRDVDALVLDLQDVGTRTWTYVGSMVYAIRTAGRLHLPIIVLDRPNPITGRHVSGPMLDAALANPNEQTASRAALPYALYSFPLRHGMTMGEMALFYNAELHLEAPLHVVPVSGWQRGMWFDQTGLPWVKPSPNLPTLTATLLYPSLVPFEGSNVSVGRGTASAFQQFGAPWMDAPRVAALLTGRHIPGVSFRVESFVPSQPGDGKYGGRTVHGVWIDVTDRDAVPSGRLGADILWAVQTANRDSLRITPRTFDLRFGSPQIREAIQQGEDPDVAVQRDSAAVSAFIARTARYRLYDR